MSQKNVLEIKITNFDNNFDNTLPMYLIEHCDDALDEDQIVSIPLSFDLEYKYIITKIMNHLYSKKHVYSEYAFEQNVSYAIDEDDLPEGVYRFYKELDRVLDFLLIDFKYHDVLNIKYNFEEEEEVEEEEEEEEVEEICKCGSFYCDNCNEKKYNEFNGYDNCYNCEDNEGEDEDEDEDKYCDN